MIEFLLTLLLGTCSSLLGIDPSSVGFAAILDASHSRQESSEPEEGPFDALVARAPELLRPLAVAVGSERLEGLVISADPNLEAGPTFLLTAFDRALGEAWVRALVERARAEPRALAALQRARIVVLPALGLLDGDATRFGVDFPVGWLPGTLRPGAAEVPLATNGTRRLAEWMVQQPGLVAVLALDGPDRSASSVEDATTRVLRSGLRGARTLRPVGGSHDGGWLDFAREALGLWTLTTEGDVEPAAGAAEFLEFVGRAPRLDVRLKAAEPLAVGLWQVDLTFVNDGALPTHVPFGPGRRDFAPSIAWQLTGGRPIAIARRNGDLGSFQVGRVRPGSLLEPALEAHAARTVRLVVELDGETGTLHLRGGGPRLGNVQLDVPLGLKVSPVPVPEEASSPPAPLEPAEGLEEPELDGAPAEQAD